MCLWCEHFFVGSSIHAAFPPIVDYYTIWWHSIYDLQWDRRHDKLKSNDGIHKITVLWVNIWPFLLFLNSVKKIGNDKVFLNKWRNEKQSKQVNCSLFWEKLFRGPFPNSRGRMVVVLYISCCANDASRHRFFEIRQNTFGFLISN